MTKGVTMTNKTIEYEEAEVRIFFEKDKACCAFCPSVDALAIHYGNGGVDEVLGAVACGGHTHLVEVALLDILAHRIGTPRELCIGRHDTHTGSNEPVVGGLYLGALVLGCAGSIAIALVTLFAQSDPSHPRVDTHLYHGIMVRLLVEVVGSIGRGNAIVEVARMHRDAFTLCPCTKREH